MLFMFQIVTVIHFFFSKAIAFKNASFIEPEILRMKQSGFFFTGRGLLKFLWSTGSFAKKVKKVGYVNHV